MSNQTTNTDESTADEVQSFLQYKGFSNEVQEAFEGWAGGELLCITSSEDLPVNIGSEGKRLVMVIRSINQQRRPAYEGAAAAGLVTSKPKRCSKDLKNFW